MSVSLEELKTDILNIVNFDRNQSLNALHHDIEKITSDTNQSIETFKNTLENNLTQLSQKEEINSTNISMIKGQLTEVDFDLFGIKLKLPSFNNSELEILDKNETQHIQNSEIDFKLFGDEVDRDREVKHDEKT